MRRPWVTWLARRLADPAVLTIVAAVFLVSAAGQGLAQAYLHDESVAVVAGFSIAGSLFLAAAIVAAARRHDRANRTPRPPEPDPPDGPVQRGVVGVGGDTTPSRG